MHTIYELRTALHESFIKDLAVLVGDTTWTEMMREAKEVNVQFSAEPFPDTDKGRGTMFIGGVPVMTNHIPGTSGWIIGERESVVRMRDAIYASQHTHIFHDTPEGRLHGVYKNEQLGTL